MALRDFPQRLYFISRRVFSLCVALVAVFCISLCGLALSPRLAFAAEPDPDAVVQFRKLLMKETESALLSIALLLRGAVLDEASLSVQAQILSLSSRRSGEAFAYRTRGVREKTTAHERVWSESKDFQELMRKFSEDAQAFANLAKRSEGDESLRASLGSSLGNLGKQCKACHKRYRTEK